MQDQKQHLIISICSIIVGNQISERIGSKPEQDKAPESIAAAPAVGSVEVGASVEPTVAAAQSQKEQKRGLQPVIGKAVGTLLLAFLVWLIFGRRSRKPEQAE